MNVVFSVRFFISWMTTICLIAIPRLLYYFEARHEVLDAMLSPWFTFIVILFVGGLIAYPVLKNVRLAIPVVLGIVAIAAFLTFPICGLPLPW